MIDMVFETKDLSDSVIHRLSVASDDIDDDVKLKLSEKKISYTYRQWMVLIALAYGNFCVASCVSLQAPFFPAECDKKNVTPQVYGLIFGVYELVILTFSPIFGKMVSVWMILRAKLIGSIFCLFIFCLFILFSFFS